MEDRYSSLWGIFNHKVYTMQSVIKDFEAASDCIDFILELEAEDYFEQAAQYGITKANWELKWDEISHIYVSALKAIGKTPHIDGFDDFEL